MGEYTMNELLLKELIEKIAKIVDQQSVIISHLNGHTEMLIKHERALAKCVNCMNYQPQSVMADTEITPSNCKKERCDFKPDDEVTDIENQLG